MLFPKYDPTIFKLHESLDPEQYIFAYYYAEHAAADILTRAAAIAVEQSSGTWVPVPYETQSVRDRSVARVIGVWELPDFNTMPEVSAETPRHFIAGIAYPVANIKDQFPGLLTTLYGNISMVTNLKLMDVHFPRSFTKHFKGPKFGIEGVRKILNVKERPLLVGMFKPCVGALPNAIEEMFFEMGVGGIDIVKDDELLLDPDFCSIEARLEACLRANERVKKETGRKILYAVNITDSPSKMHRHAEMAMKMGNNMLMIDVFTTGYSVVQEFTSNPDYNVPILGHPAMAGAFYASPQWGFTAALALGKFIRMAGPDMMIYPSQYGKVPLVKERAIRVAQEHRSEFHHLKPLFPGPSAGNHPGLMNAMITDFGPDIIVGAGGGIHGHPGGIIAGGKAFHQAIEAAMAKYPLREAATQHKELRQALEKWGVQEEGTKIYDLIK